MKLKLKFTNGRPNCPLLVDDTKIQNYGQLRGQIAAFLDDSVAFHLSLNYGKDILQADADVALQELGLVSGDVLTVVLSEDISHAPEQVLETRAAEVHAKNTMATEEQNVIDRKNVNGYVYQIRLCRESEPGVIPKMLECFYLTQPVESTFDALIVVIHRLMREVGFDPLVTQSLPLLSQWKTINGHYKMEYCDPACPSNSCQLVCIALKENILVIHAVLCDGPSKDIIMNLAIHCDKYLLDFPTKKCDPKQLYCNLPKLSHLFKDAIALPLLNVIRMDAGIPTKSDFMSLPIELKQMILNYLNGRCLVTMSKVCTDLNQLCSDGIFWRRCLAREFPHVQVNQGDKPQSDWKKRYIEIYKKQYERKKSFPSVHSYHFMHPISVRTTFGGGLPDLLHDFEANRNQIPLDIHSLRRNYQDERRRMLEDLNPFGAVFPRLI